jgi:uncharacterized protein (DUF433 family)
MVSRMRLGVFSAEQVCRLAKISETQLRYWHRTNVFRPQRLADPLGPFRQAYSFRDVVGLRTVSILRNEYELPLKRIRDVEKKLKETSDADWSNVSFYIGEAGGIYFIDPKRKSPTSVHPIGQAPLFRMRTMIRGVEKQLKLMNRRTRSQIGKIDRSRYIMRNVPVIAGTRIPTNTIFDLYQNRFTIAQIIIEYPRLTRSDVQAAIQFQQLQVAS